MTNGKLAKNTFLLMGAAATATIIFYGVKADRLARIGAGYKAKIACSEIFLAGRDAPTVLETEFAGIDPMMDQISVRVDADRKTTSAAAPLGLGRAQAAFRDGYGCTLANGGRIFPLPKLTPFDSVSAWAEAPPVSGAALDYVDYGALDFTLNEAFEPNDANHRAVLVVVDGKIVEERYAEGFSSETPFLSWSAGKSVTATLIGAAALQGYLDINDPAPVAEWQSDPQRARITWNNLLQMQSGLEFTEEYGEIRSDVNRMLFEATDAGAVAAKKDAIHGPGEAWYYSSGTTNLISRTLRQVLEAAGVNYHQFSKDVLFNPIGAATATMETDASGAFIGSSFVYATARDWARLGQLYLQNGEWAGARLIPEDWANYVSTPANASDGQYGAHFWLNRDGADGRERFIPGAPEEMYFMAGHEGQYVFIVPSKRTIIVRTGMTRGQRALPVVAPLIKDILDAIGAPPV